jgi:hypothetical protein
MATLVGVKIPGAAHQSRQLGQIAICLAVCNSQSEIYNFRSFAGVLAQLVERLNGIEEVTGSNPVGSTPF